MKKFTKSSLLLLLAMFLMQACTKDIVPNPESLNDLTQPTLYSENFDESALVIPNLPAGWVASGDSGWVLDSSNSSIGYTGASGKNNIDISNSTVSGGTFTLTSIGISTLGYDNIAVTYGARRTKHFSDNGSAITSFAYSIDGGTTWNSIQYTENPGDSNWYLVNNKIRIHLPSAAANQASVMFRWTAHLFATSSGTYRIDDFQVFGTGL